MNCPKCENELREDMFCENCNEYLFNMDKDKKKRCGKKLVKSFWYYGRVSCIIYMYSYGCSDN